MDLNILFLDRRGCGYVGAAQTRHEFEQTVAQQCNCKFAGERWPLHQVDETMDETVRRVMPDADWVIDSDNNLHNKKPSDKSYRVGHFISDLHGKHHYKIGTPAKYVELLNSVGYDVVFMRYPLVYGTGHSPKIVYDRLVCEKHWVPWSVDADFYKPSEKTIDVSLIGRTSKTYPLRQKMWDNIHRVGSGYNIVREEAPYGTTYQRDVKSLIGTHLVGTRYRDVLAETRIMLFGCSVYRYALQKFTQASASQCLVMSNEPSMGKRLGFVDGETYVKIYEADWEEKLLYYLSNPKEAEIIAKRGRKNTLEHHTHKVRARQWLDMLS